jgi:predicted dehydrogenase
MGIIGTARIAPVALVAPALEVPGVEVVAVASRDGERAERFAREHGIPCAYTGYEALMRSDALDAVYIALPASEHARWSVRALEHGLHVLVEKPIASNGNEAARVVDAAIAAKRVLVEALHWRYHPLADLMIELTCQLGTLHSARVQFEVAKPSRDDIRWDLSLSGGALMDLGCYAVHWLRSTLAGEPTVVEARATVWAPDVDAAMEASLLFPTGVRAHLYVSMLREIPPADFVALFEAKGELGFVRILNPLTPQAGHLVEYEIKGRGAERLTLTSQSTYSFQLEAFRAAIMDGVPPLTGGADAVANMRVLDQIYRAAQMRPRAAGQGVTSANPTTVLPRGGSCEGAP